MQVENEGQIQVIELPESWTERAIQRQPLGLKTMRSFHSNENANVQVRFVYRGHPESDETGERFRLCLSTAPHRLDKSEINSLGNVLGELAEPSQFNLTSAQTMDLGGKRVLWAEGHWLSSPYWTGVVFINADGTGRVIQEVACFSALDTYESMRAAFQKILNSIRWK